MRTDEERRDDALEDFMGQVDAHTTVVLRIARYLRDEGAASYARPLEAACRNLDHAFADLRWDLLHGDEGAIQADNPSEAIDKLLDKLDDQEED